MDAKALLRAARSPKPGLVIAEPYTVHGHVVERITFDGKLVGHRIDGELMATNLRLQGWIEEQVEELQSAQALLARYTELQSLHL